MGLDLNFAAPPVVLRVAPSQPSLFVPPAEAPVVLDNIISPAPEPQVSRIDRLKAELGEKVGVITRSPEEVMAIIRDGVLVSVHTSRWQGTSRLTPESLGLSDMGVRAFANSRLKLGQVRLLPEVYHKAIEAAISSARAALYNVSYKTPYGYFVPTAKFKEFKAAFLAAQERFFIAVNKIVADLDTIKAGIRQEFPTLAAQAWLGMRAEWTEKGTQALGTYADVEAPTDLFVQTFIEKIVAQVPVPSEIIGKAEFYYDVAALQVPEAELANEFATSDAEVNSELRQHLIDGKRKYIDNFLLSVRDTLAERMLTLVQDVQSSLEGRETIHGKTLPRMLRALEQLKELNCVGDKEIGEMIHGLQSFVVGQSAQKEKPSADSVKLAMQQAAARIKDIMTSNPGAKNQFAAL